MSSLANKSFDFGTEVSNNRTSSISKITIHHMAGNYDPVNCAKSQKDRNVSANYYIGSDGTIVSGVSEDRRAWTSGNGDNDHAAITIEVANNSGGPNWTVSKQAYNSLIALCVDICIRYKIILNWTGKADGTLTCHYMFKPSECPGAFLKSKMSDIASTVNYFVKQLNNN